MRNHWGDLVFNSVLFNAGHLKNQPVTSNKKRLFMHVGERRFRTLECLYGGQGEMLLSWGCTNNLFKISFTERLQDGIAERPNDPRTRGTSRREHRQWMDGRRLNPFLPSPFTVFPVFHDLKGLISQNQSFWVGRFFQEQKRLRQDEELDLAHAVAV